MVIRGRSRNEFRRHWQTDGESRDKVVEVVENRLNGFFFLVFGFPQELNQRHNNNEKRVESTLDNRRGFLDRVVYVTSRFKGSV